MLEINKTKYLMINFLILLLLTSCNVFKWFLNVDSKVDKDFISKNFQDTGDDLGTDTPQTIQVAPIPNTSWLNHIGQSTTIPGTGIVSNDKCFSVAVDLQGNVYCAGATNSPLGEAVGGSSDAFIMKLNVNGDISWITQLGSATNTTGNSHVNNDYCYAVAVDHNGNVYCAGSTHGAIGESNSGVGNGDVFVIKLNKDGDILWETQLGDTTTFGDNNGDGQCNSIAVDQNENVYCAGHTTGNLGENAGGGTDAFVMKLDSFGNKVWMKHFGSTTMTNLGGNAVAPEELLDIAVDANGNVYAAGFTSGNFAGVGSNSGVKDLLVVKLNSDGSIAWINQQGTGGDDECKGVAVDDSGSFYCAGYTSGSLGEGNAGGKDAFVLKLNSDGSHAWTKQIGSVTQIAPNTDKSVNDVCEDIALDASGNIFCSGHTTGKLSDNENSGLQDAFVMKLDSSGNFQWITQIRDSIFTGDASGNEFCKGIAIDHSANIYCAGYTTGHLIETNGGLGNFDIFVFKLAPDGSF